MAGDWIKMRSNLWDDPRIAKLCDLTDQTEAAIIGGLYWLWSSADQHSEDGTMNGLTLRGIDRKTGIAGFGSALVSACWLAETSEGVQIVRFEEHNGKSAKRRCSEAVRKMSARDADKEQTEIGNDAHLEKEKEKEKRIEDQKQGADAPKDKSSAKPPRFDPLSLDLPAGLSVEAWVEWISYRRTRKLTCAEPTIRGQLSNLSAWAQVGHSPGAVIRASIDNGWQGLFEPKGGGTNRPAQPSFDDIDYGEIRDL